MSQSRCAITVGSCWSGTCQKPSSTTKALQQVNAVLRQKIPPTDPPPGYNLEVMLPLHQTLIRILPCSVLPSTAGNKISPLRRNRLGVRTLVCGFSANHWKPRFESSLRHHTFWLLWVRAAHFRLSSSIMDSSVMDR